eukprot:m.113350 g.113350  ORF g.113350 m.113350 type:complete len:2370 (-) comp15356_c3_seq2:346-7455(-)
MMARDSIHLLFLAVALAAHAVIADNYPPNGGWRKDDSTGHQYYFSNGDYEATRAQRLCQEDLVGNGPASQNVPAYFTVISTSQEAEFIFDQIGESSREFWIGQYWDKNRYVAFNGDDSATFFLSDSSPDRSEPCLRVLKNNRAYDQECDEEYRIICEWSPAVTCSPGKYRAKSSNTCKQCDNGKFKATTDQATSCASWTTCSSNEGEVSAPSSSADRTCRRCQSNEDRIRVDGVYVCLCKNGYEPTSTAGECRACDPGSVQLSRSQPCTTCTAGKYQDQSAQTACKQISTCQPGTYVSQTPTPAQNRLCSNCESGSYSKIQNAASCTPYTDCASMNQEQTKAPTPTSDRECRACTPNVEYFDAASAQCQPISTCQPGQRVTQNPTATQNRLCANCGASSYSTTQNADTCTTYTDCAAMNQEQTKAPTPTSDRECRECMTNVEYFNAATAQCEQLRTCVPGEFVTQQPSLTQNRECTACGPNSYSATTNSLTCTPHTSCAASYQEEITAPTPTSDSTCRSCVIGQTYYNSNSRTCQAVSSCPAGAYISVEATISSDAVCAPDSFTCQNGMQVGTSNACSCADIDDACVLCELQPSIAAQYSSVLLMLNEQPQVFGYVSSDYIHQFDPTVVDEVQSCEAKCISAISSGCIGFSLRYTGTKSALCSLLSTYQVTNRYAESRARLYSLSRCQGCQQGFEVDGLGCTVVTDPPVLSASSLSALIPLNLPVDTTILTVSASTNAPTGEDIITYNLQSTRFALDPNTGAITLKTQLVEPVSEVLIIKASDSRPSCNRIIDNALVKTPGPCTSSVEVTIRVASLLGCPPKVINEYVLPDVSYRRVNWTTPRFPASAPGLTLQLFQGSTMIDATTTFFDAPIGSTTFTYRSLEALSIGSQLECSFTINVRKGLFIYVNDIDLQVVETLAQAYILASRGLADAARLISFTSSSYSPGFIGLQPISKRPFIISVPEDMTAAIYIALRWCTDTAEFPTRPATAENATSSVLLVGTPSSVTPPAFIDQGSWVYESNNGRRCIELVTQSERFVGSLEFSTLELQFIPPNSQRKRRLQSAADTYWPAFPSYVVVDMQPINGTTITANLEGAVTTEDLVPPILDCPPPVEDTTFVVAPGQVSAVVTLPTMTAYDSVDPDPQIVYPFTSKSLSAIDSPHSVTVYAVDSSNNRRECTFDVIVQAEENPLYVSEIVTEWVFPYAQLTIEPLKRTFVTHEIHSNGGDIGRFEANVGELTELRFTFASPSTAVPFVVRDRPGLIAGRIAVDLAWLADGVTDFLIQGAQNDVRTSVELENYQPTAANGVLERRKVFALDNAQVAVNDAEGVVAVQAKSDDFVEPFSFTSISVIVRFLGVTGIRGNTNWTITNSSYVGVEYEFGYDSVTKTPKADDVQGFLSLLDQSPPFFEYCPPDIWRNAFKDDFRARPAWNDPVAKDNRAVTSLIGDATPPLFVQLRPPGSELFAVTYVAMDAFGNEATCSFTIEIRDSQPPTVSSGRVQNKVLPSTSNVVSISQADWWPEMVWDNALGDPNTEYGMSASTWAQPTLVSHDAQATYALGVHTVSMLFEDAYGNQASAHSIINVTDTTPPVLVCPSDIERLTQVDVPDREVTWVLKNATDNSGLATHMFVSNSSGTRFPIGEHTVKVSASDMSGNMVNCSFTVKIVGQFSPPSTPRPPQVNNTLTPSAAQASASLDAGIVGGAGGGFFILVVVAVALFARRVRARSRAPQNWDDIFKLMEQFKDSEDGPRIPREINRSGLKLLGELGKGAFGIVYKGMLKEHASIPGYLVAVKSLHNNDSLADRQELLEEAAVMAQFDNPHVVELVGVVTIGKPVYVIVEFMEHGSLKSYLENNEVPLETKVLWAGDCCDGLAHVHSKGFIHRDVAARNVLLSSEMRCKISDFGLAREMEEDDTYYKSRGGQLPVRWTAIEALEDRKFNEKTDVWSCGVLIHEIWTRADLPYKGWSNQKVWVEVAAGYRLPQPENCREDVYAKMRECWADLQEDRPSFALLADFFRSLYTELTGEDVREDYLQVGSEPSIDEFPRPSGFGGLLRRLSGTHMQNPMYGGSKRASIRSEQHTAPKQQPQPDGAALYDMGEENNEEEENGAEGADLYDMGQDDTSARLPPLRSGGRNDSIENIPLASVSTSKRQSQVSLLSATSFGPEGGFQVSEKDIGARVKVEAYNCTGTLLFFGLHHKKGILRCGVALDEPVGLNNGTVGGHKYFDCAEQHGVLCNPSKVSVVPNNDDGFGFDEQVDAVVKLETQAAEETFAGDLYGNVDMDEGDMAATQQQGDRVSDIDVGKRVKVQGYSCPGTLRFFGKHHENGALRCGVELDEPEGKNNGTVGGHVYFSCQVNHGVLCSPSKVTVLG